MAQLTGAATVAWIMILFSGSWDVLEVEAGDEDILELLCRGDGEVVEQLLIDICVGCESLNEVVEIPG